MSDKFQDIYRIPSARADWWDYRNGAAYFVTICTASREHYLGEIGDGNIHLSEIGKIAHTLWRQIPNHFPFIKLDVMVVMPNHVHGILLMKQSFETTPVETLHATSLPQVTDPPETKNEEMAAISPKQGSLSSVIRSYKSSVSREAHLIQADFQWQSRFYDHIIRDEQEYWKIRQYILNNPKYWAEDKYYQRL